jgi:hypothetical protein
LKRPLHERLIRAGLIHATALRVGSDPVSIHLDIRDGDRVLLYLLVHEPAVARESPGSLHVMLLAPTLAAEGFGTFDLSPGEGYKDRFANRTDVAHGLVVRFGRRDRAIRRFVVFATTTIRRALRRTGHEDAIRRNKVVAAISAGWTGIGPGQRGIASAVLDQVRTWKRQDRGGLKRFEIDDDLVLEPSQPRGLERDSIEALLDVSPERGGRSAVRAFLADALERLEAGQVAYTRRAGDRLDECWWVSEGGGAAADRSAPATTIQLGYLDARATAAPVLVQSLREIIATERTGAGHRWALELLPDRDVAVAAAIAMGFQRVAVA